MQSLHESELKQLKKDIEEKESLWEEARQKSVDLSKQLNEQTTKVMKLQRMIVRAGCNDESPIDADITSRFTLLKSDILQMVKSHLLFQDKTRHPISPELGELYMKKIVALALYDAIFARKNMPFGHDDWMLDNNPIRIFEDKLRKSRCDGMLSHM